MRNNALTYVQMLLTALMFVLHTRLLLCALKNKMRNQEMYHENLYTLFFLEGMLN